ncbi:MAG: glycosyl hydrolase family 65 protein, partial [Bacteroidota bacterium]
AISRFWRQRITFSASKNQYVMLGVTGPNEYENNVNNNWYTNTIACWTLEYTVAVLDRLRQERPDALKALAAKVNLAEERETEEWQDIIENMYYPHLEDTRVFLQQEGYMDKEQSLVKDLDQAERPLNQHWSWDRILRSPYIKQADVLQGIYFLEDRYDLATIRENFDFYEPRTVHESSLSPCVHVVLAARLGEVEQAHQLYLRTARLDLDDYNQEAAEGLHITSMAGTWMAVVEGFGGMRVRKGHLSFDPVLPAKWKGFSFQVIFGGACIQVRVTPDAVTVANTADQAVSLTVWDQEITLPAKGEETVSRIQAQTV